MMWWDELPHAARALIQMWGAFFVVAFMIYGGAELAEWWKRRRR